MIHFRFSFVSKVQKLDYSQDNKSVFISIVEMVILEVKYSLLTSSCLKSESGTSEEALKVHSSGKIIHLCNDYVHHSHPTELKIYPKSLKVDGGHF